MSIQIWRSAIVTLSMTLVTTLLPHADCRAWQEQPIVRELFVPYEELDVVLEADPHRVFLQKEEYEALIEAAEEQPIELLPRDYVWTNSQSLVELLDSRVTVEHTVSFEILRDSTWFLLPLDLANIGLREAILDGAQASIVRTAEGGIGLLIRGKGIHELVLRGTSLVTQAAAQQSVQFTLPRATAHRTLVTVSGNVELKSGAPVLTREYDEATNRTRFEVVPFQNGVSMTFSTNNKQDSDEQQLLAHSVLIDEMTQGYERLHATVSLKPLRGRLSEVGLKLPAGFEVTRADAPEVARWEVVTGDEGSRLQVTFNEELTRQVVLQITLNRSASSQDEWLKSLESWEFPRLEPQGTQSHVALMGLWVEDRLVPSRSRQTGLLQVDSNVLGAVTPVSLTTAEPGAPVLRQTASFVAPDSSFEWNASIVRQESMLFATLSTVATVGDRSIEARGSISIRSEGEARFEFPWSIPSGWQLVSLADASGQSLVWEETGEGESGERLIKVRIPRGIRPGEPQLFDFHFEGVPEQWLDDWTSRALSIPDFRLSEGVIERGSIAIVSRDDLRVLPLAAEGMIPLVESEKGAIGWNFPTDLAFRYAGPAELELEVSRKEPQLAANIYTLFHIEVGVVRTVSELQYSIQGAAARELQFSLPGEAPKEVAIRGLDGLALREVMQSEVDGRTLWTVRLATPVVQRARIEVSFDTVLADKEEENWNAFFPRAERVNLGASTFAVDSSPEYDVQITTDARVVDEGEMAASDLNAGRRRVGTWQSLDRDTQLAVELLRRKGYGLPTAVVQAARLTTQLSVNGQAQTRVDYSLQTKATLLEVRLPQASRLWAVLIDDVPIKPQREGERLLLGIPVSESSQQRTLSMVYETSISPMSWTSNLELPAPLLLSVNSAGEAESIPVAELQWQVVPPPGYRVQQRAGEVQAVYRSRPLTGPEQLVGMVAWLFRPLEINVDFGSLSPTMSPMSAQLAIPDSAARSYDMPMSMESGNAAPMDGAEAYAAPGAAGAFGANGLEPMSEFRDQMFDDEKKDAESDLALSDRLDAAREVAPESPANRPSEPAPTLGLGGASDGSPADPAAQRGARTREPLGTEQSLPADRMLGVGSLQIPLENNGEIVEFFALGEAPRLSLSLYTISQVDIAGVFVGAAAFLFGLFFRRTSRGTRAVLILALLAFGGVPGAISSAFDPWMPIFNGLFFAGVLLVVVEACWSWLLEPIVRAFRRCCGACCRWMSGCCGASTTTASILVSMVLVGTMFIGTSSLSVAQEPAPSSVDVDAVLDWLQHLEGPVQVPGDAIVIPFDPDRPESMEAPTRMLVPYAKYVELWNRAYPDRPLEPQANVYRAAIAAAEYTATLDDSRELVVRGTLTIDLFDDSEAVLPLPLAGATLTSARLDDRAARLQVVTPDQVRLEGLPPLHHAFPPATLLVSVDGKGRHELVFEARLEVTKQGGWSTTSAYLPTAIASSITLTVPAAGTEIKQLAWLDRSSFETTAPGEKIETSLAESGQWELRWRTGQQSVEVDRALTASSEALFDVRDDGSRMTWRMHLSFPGSQRDSLAFLIPENWSVDQIESEQLSGFAVRTDGDRQLVDVTLLQAIRDGVSLVVYLSRRESLIDRVSEIEVPYLSVQDAALESGVIGVRRSPRLELKTQLDDGLTRADYAGVFDELGQLAERLDPTVLSATAYQAFRFVKPPFALRLQSSPATLASTGHWRAALRVDRREVAIDASLRVVPQGQPIYRVSLAWPKGYQLTRIAPESLEWSITEEEDRRVLSIDLLNGRTDPFEIAIFARTDRATDVMQGVGDRLELPTVLLSGLTSWTGEWAVLADPDTDVQLQNLIGARERQVTGANWLGAAQRGLAKRLLEVSSDQPYAADVVLMPKAPVVTGRTLTNVRVTDRSIESTTLFDFDIRQAGVSRLSVTLPEDWSEARVSAPLVRRQTSEPALNESGEVREGWVTMTFELQDAVRDKYSILMELDQPLTRLAEPMPLPEIVTGQTNRRLVAIENAGRDELVINDSSLVGLQAVGRQQQVWREVTENLGDSISHLFQANTDSTSASFELAVLERQEVERVGARIGLAVHTLVIDQAGGYRAKVEYRIDNASEPYLEIRLPEGATLWATVVAGEGVKPIDTGSGDSRQVRIPLIRTELGDSDYPIIVLYGGRCAAPGQTTPVQLPLINDTSVNVELSQLRLFLPEDHQWYFDGSMKQVTDEREFAVGFQNYLGQRIKEAQRALETVNDFGLIRAANNLSQVRQLYEANVSQLSSLSGENSHELNMAQAGNEALLREAELKIQEELAERQEQVVDNRERLNSIHEGQQLQRSSNVVSDLGQNFFAPESETGLTVGAEFNSSWYMNNSLMVQGQPQIDIGRRGGLAPENSSNRVYQGRGGGNRQLDDDSLRSQNFRTQELFENESQQQGQALVPGMQEADEVSRLDRYSQRVSGALSSPSAVPPTSGPASTSGQAGEGRWGDDVLSVAQGDSAGFGGGGFSNSDLGYFEPAEFSDSGLVSLDLQIPERGELFLFTTPRGELEVVARGVKDDLLERLILLVAIVIGWLIAFVIARRVTRDGAWRWPGSSLGAAVVLLSGLAITFVVGPSLMSLALMAWGIGRLVWNRFARGTTESAAA